MAETKLKIAVFIDFDNIEIGVKTTLGSHFDAGAVLEAIKERGDVVTKIAYGDWTRAGDYSRSLTQHAIHMVQRNLTPGGDKNGADINLALDALEMAFTHPHINAFVIVGGDSDFISLVEKLKQYDKKVFIVGGRQFTSGILQRNCNEFIAYENLIGVSSSGTSARRQHGGRQVKVDRTPVEQAIPLVRRALEVMTEREVSPQIGLLKSTLLQLDSTFSERNYGASSFRDFVDRLAQLGVVTVTQAKGGWLVGPAAAGAQAGADRSAQAIDGRSARSQPQAPEAGDAPGQTSAAAAPPRSSPASTQPSSAPPSTRGTPADGLREFRQILTTSQIRRWPMYLRNVKQIMRQAATPFDERAFGFASLVDLLRAAQKENIVRVERDRQGVIRVFQGSAPPGLPIEDPVAVDVEVVETPPDVVDVSEPVDVQSVDEDDEAEAAPVQRVAQEETGAAAVASKPVRSRRSRSRRQPSEPAAPAVASPSANRGRRRRTKTA